MGKPLLLAVLFASSSAGLAHAQSGPDRDELTATMRVLAPEASDADSIYRRIPPPRSKKPAVGDDAPARDLASPGAHGGDSGSAGDPGGALDPGTVADPGTPIDPPLPPDPVIPAAPDPRDAPGDFGHGVADDARNHGEDARRHEHQQPHHDDKPPKEDKPPRHEPRDREPPRDRQPRDPPRDHRPPGHEPRDPPRGPGDKPRKPRE